MTNIVFDALRNNTDVAFVCIGNTCRSPMMAELFRQQFRRDSDVSIVSAGCHENARKGDSAAPEWNTLRDETGIDLRAHRSRHFDSLNLQKVGAFVAVDTSARDALLAAGIPEAKVMTIAVTNPWTVEDNPPGARLAAYRTCFRDAQRVVAELMDA